MAVEKESSVDFIPKTVEEEYAMLAGRLKAVEAYLDTSDSDYIDKKRSGCHVRHLSCKQPRRCRNTNRSTYLT